VNQPNGVAGVKKERQKWVRPKRAPLDQSGRQQTTRAFRSRVWLALRDPARQIPWLTALIVGALFAISYIGSLVEKFPTATGATWRIGGLALVGFALFAKPNPRRFLQFSSIFAPWLFAVFCLTIVQAMSSTDNAIDAVLDFARHAALIIGASLIYSSLGTAKFDRRVRVTMFAVAIFLTILSVYTIRSSLGHGWTYNVGRELKATAISEGLGANAFCYAGLLALVAGYRHSITAAVVSAALVLFMVFAAIILTARAPIVAMLIASVIAGVLARRKFWGWFHGQWSRSIIISSIVIVVPVVVFFASIHTIAFSPHAKALAGRAALWQIAITEAPRHILVGTGPRTFTDVIRASLGEGVYPDPFEKQAIYSLTGGGFHNIWLNTLVERGLVGFAGLLASFILLTAHIFRSMYQLRPMQRFTALAVLLFVLTRNFVEITGLMSYADSSTDLLVILALVLVIVPYQATGRGEKTLRPKPRVRKAGVGAVG